MQAELRRTLTKRIRSQSLHDLWNIEEDEIHRMLLQCPDSILYVQRAGVVWRL